MYMYMHFCCLLLWVYKYECDMVSYFYRACVGLPPLNHMVLEHKVPALMAQHPIMPLPIQSMSHSKAPPQPGSHSVANGNALAHAHANGVVANGY